MAGVYIHIPFCKTFCPYCDFYSIEDKGVHGMFVKAVQKEAEIRKDYLGEEPVTTIYFGGGTPSLLTAAELKEILKSVRKHFVFGDEPEITIEVNPDDAELTYLTDLKKTGFNRLSLGIQSWDEKTLRMLKRRHTAIDSAEAIENAIRAGFENISADLIYGIPGYSLEKWCETIDKTISYDIKHISAYHLTIEPGTVFGKKKKAGRLEEADEEASNSQYEALLERTGQAGYIQYEISNFGKEGWFSKHNSNYWRQVSYIGLGPSAHSFDKSSRQWNIKNLDRYINALAEGKEYFSREEINPRKKFNEYIMTSLRTMWGIDLEYIEKNFEKEGYDYVVNLSGRFINYGLMRFEDHKLVLTQQGKIISDNIITEFMMT